MVLTNAHLSLMYTLYMCVCVCVCVCVCACVHASACRVLVGRAEGKRPLGRTRRTWEDNIKIVLKEVGWGDMDWVALAQYRGRWRANVNAVLKLRVPYNAGNFLNSWETVSLLEMALLHGVTTCIHTCYMGHSVPMYVHERTLEAAALTVFMAWLPTWWLRLTYRLTL